MNRQRQGQGQKPRKQKRPTIQKVLIVLIVIASLALVALIVYGLSPNEDGERPQIGFGTSSRNPGGASSATPEATPGFITDQLTGIESYNPLTGMPMDSGKTKIRPLAIVLGNTADAMPMNGVSQADIIYEVPVEGGYTRMLAIFQDFFYVEKVGSIRSARHYTAQITESYDAIFITAGTSPQALAEVRERGIPHLNEVEGPNREIFFRDRNRVDGRRLESLHSVVTTNERVMQWLPEYDFRLLHDANFKQTLSFVDDGTPSGGGAADEVSVRFSAGKTTTFIYNDESKAYNVRQFNRDFIDANDNSHAAFANVLILKTSVTPIPGDDSGRVNVETVGEGEGYFVNGGRFIQINWSRADKSSPFVYTLRNGSDLELGRGSTYICIIPTNMSATFE